jgi:hypothetical protein
MHLSHYDPVWFANKAKEKPFDLDTGLACVDAMAEAGLNVLVIDCEDGVKYASHPELARPYSVPMATLRALVERTHRHGIETVPKINFARSHLHHHNDWFRPHNKLFDTPEYWRLASEVIDELIENVRPPRFFHVGMDEDHDRSTRQYAQAIITLRDILKARRLRPVIWNDSAWPAEQWPQVQVHAERCILAEKKIPRNVVEVLWDYETTQPRILRRLLDGGFEVWAAPGGTVELVTQAVRVLKRLGGSGVLLTRWGPTHRKHRKELVNWIRAVGPACSA